MNNYIEVAVPAVIAAVGGGWAILKMFSRFFQKQQADLERFIESRFSAAEQQRALASSHWQQLFKEIQRREDRNSKRIEQLEDKLSRHQAYDHPRIGK